jgi:TonB family protein
MPRLQWPNRAWSRHALAVSIAVGLHAVAVLVLISHWQTSPPPEPPSQVMTTQLITLTPPQPPAPEPVVAAPVPLPVQPEVLAPAPKPVVAKPVEVKPKPTIDHAALARKRVQEQEQQAAERAQQLAEQQRQQQAVAAAKAQADAKARAAADALAAESRPYLPVSKEAPEYPDKALEKGIEGDCTVTYTVTPQGRVDNPQVLGQCHPLLVRPSLAAARTFRYQPRIVDGQAVSVSNVKNTFHYRIE